MKFDIASETAAYKAEMREIDKRNAERWQAFAERIRKNDHIGTPQKVRPQNDR